MKKSFWFLLVLSLLFWFSDTKRGFNWLHHFFASLTHRSRQASIPVISSDQDDQIKIAGLELKITQLEEENKAARRLLGAGLSPKLKFTPAHFLGLSKSEFVLDKGSLEGVGEGAWVLAKNVLVGKITKTNPFTAWGELVTNRDFRLAVGIWRFGEKEKQLVGKGLLHGGQAPLIKEIFPEEEVEIDDLVASLEKGGQFLVGRIIQVDWDEGKVFKKAQLDWLANPRELSVVMVVKR